MEIKGEELVQNELTREELENTNGGSFLGFLRDCVLAVAYAADWVYDMTDDFQNNDSRTLFPNLF